MTAKDERTEARKKATQIWGASFSYKTGQEPSTVAGQAIMNLSLYDTNSFQSITNNQPLKGKK
jgi:hypothetical protein